MLRSPKLTKGDLVSIISPASYPPVSDIDHHVNVLEAWGLRYRIGRHALKQHGYMAGTDTERLEDINEAIRDPDVRAIIATRGGAGAYRIADDLDFAALRQDPKPIVGFSDITSLHLSSLHHSGVGNLHGCLFGSTAIASCKQLLMTTDPLQISRTEGHVSGAVQFPGFAKGPLIGGNLQMMATSVGVRLPSFKGAIVLLEYHRAGLGTVDRYLTQLIRSGSLEGVAGIALGSFEAARGHIDRGWTMVDVLQDRLGRLGVPVLGGLYVGHDFLDEDNNHDQYVVPLGSEAVMDVDAGTLIVKPIVE